MCRCVSRSTTVRSTTAVHFTEGFLLRSDLLYRGATFDADIVGFVTTKTAGLGLLILTGNLGGSFGLEQRRLVPRGPALQLVVVQEYMVALVSKSRTGNKNQPIIHYLSKLM